MNSVLNRHGLVKRFMESSGYTNTTYESGIVKNGKKPLAFKILEPEDMLKDFLRWMKDGAGKPVERDLDYNRIGCWMRLYQLDNFPTDGFETHYNSKLTPCHALIIWQLKGCVSSTRLGKAFQVDVKTIRDVWNSNSWCKLITAYEESK